MAASVLCGVKYTDKETGTTFMQDRGAWLKPYGAGHLVYMQPGHAVSDYRQAGIAQMILNAINWVPDKRDPTP